MVVAAEAVDRAQVAERVAAAAGFLVDLGEVAMGRDRKRIAGGGA